MVRSYKKMYKNHFTQQICFQTLLTELESSAINVRKMAIRQVFVVLVVSSSLYMAASDSPFCSKIDFNQANYRDFQQCSGQNFPIFVVKPYSPASDVPKYRPNSIYYLSTGYYGYSCVESVKRFSMNRNTRIEAAIFLKTTTYASIEVAIYNDQHRRVYSWINETWAGRPSSWLILRGTVFETVSNAMVSDILYSF